MTSEYSTAAGEFLNLERYDPWVNLLFGVRAEARNGLRGVPSRLGTLLSSPAPYNSRLRAPIWLFQNPGIRTVSYRGEVHSASSSAKDP